MNITYVFVDGPAKIIFKCNWDAVWCDMIIRSILL